MRDRLFVSVGYAIKYGYNVLPRMQRETGCQLLLHVSVRQCVRYPLVQAIRLPAAMQKSDCFTRILQALVKPITDLAFFHLHGRILCLINKDTRPATAMFVWQWHISQSEILEPMIDSAFTHCFIPKRFYAVLDNFVIKRNWTSCFDIAMINRRCSCYDWCVRATHVIFSRTMVTPSTLSRHGTHFFCISVITTSQTT